MILRRLAHLIAVLFFVTLFVAMLTNLLPGDPVNSIAGFAPEEQKEAVRADLGLDDPVYVQYGRWVTNFATGDLGNYYSVTGGRPVMDRVRDSLPVSLQLIVEAQVLALVFAIPLGVVTAYRAGSRFDKWANAGAFGGLAVPNFALALVLAYYVGVVLGWLPVSGYVAPSEDLGEHLRRMALPAISLAVGQIAAYMRLLRSDMIATLQEDYITMAKSKGISPARVLWRHALRPSSLTLLTVAGLNVGVLIGGAVIVEVIFSLPGMGTLLFEAIQARQFVALQSLVAIIAIGYVLINFLVDVLYGVLDPRIRHGRA
ncbi:MAG TPA: ABC transporter permease [Acidimicrobiales bacterium]|jgi:peptide/nickel transport system permease protein|nr:ABC transporter permease [Acidimicrobiales bacterium]